MMTTTTIPQTIIAAHGSCEDASMDAPTNKPISGPLKFMIDFIQSQVDNTEEANSLVQGLLAKTDKFDIVLGEHVQEYNKLIKKDPKKLEIKKQKQSAYKHFASDPEVKALAKESSRTTKDMWEEISTRSDANDNGDLKVYTDKAAASVVVYNKLMKEYTPTPYTKLVQHIEDQASAKELKELIADLKINKRTVLRKAKNRGSTMKETFIMHHESFTTGGLNLPFDEQNKLWDEASPFEKYAGAFMSHPDYVNQKDLAIIWAVETDKYKNTWGPTGKHVKVTKPKVKSTKPPTPYNLFVKENTSKAKALLEGRENRVKGDIMVELGRMWKESKESDKDTPVVEVVEKKKKKKAAKKAAAPVVEVDEVEEKKKKKKAAKKAAAKKAAKKAAAESSDE
jgi:hypothetical protein